MSSARPVTLRAHRTGFGTLEPETGSGKLVDALGPRCHRPLLPSLFFSCPAVCFLFVLSVLGQFLLFLCCSPFAFLAMARCSCDGEGRKVALGPGFNHFPPGRVVPSLGDDSVMGTGSIPLRGEWGVGMGIDLLGILDPT